jgi:D-alanine-D-alanine ligase
VPVLGSGPSARALPIIEIVAPEGNYDYQNKYFTDDTKYHCPAPLDAETTAAIQAHVENAYRALGCEGWGRVDVLLREATGGPSCWK